jgi:CRP-like cAMP-binding protein
VWIVAEGALAIVARGSAASDASVSVMRRKGAVATAGHAIGLVRVVAPGTPVVDAVAERPTTVLSIELDDMRDVLEEDPAALAALAAALARALLEGAA